MENLKNIKNNIDLQNDYSVICGAKIAIISNGIVDLQKIIDELASYKLDILVFSTIDSFEKTLYKDKFDLIITGLDSLSNKNIIKGLQKSDQKINSPFFIIDSNPAGYLELGALEIFSLPLNITNLKYKVLNTLNILRIQEKIIKDKEFFLSVITHDLKTPINSSIMVVKMLLNGDLGILTAEQKEMLEDILGASVFMKELVENILCKSKIENNKMKLYKKTCSLEQTIRKVIALAKYIIKPQNQEITFECKTRNSETSYDVLEIERVIMNLISNACYYSNPDSLIKIKLEEEQNNFIFSIQDFGKGIDLNMYNDLFNQHISYAKKFKKIGSGLGLYIAKKNIEAHCGNINIESKIGEGTTITFSLPKTN